MSKKLKDLLVQARDEVSNFMKDVGVSTFTQSGPNILLSLEKILTKLNVATTLIRFTNLGDPTEEEAEKMFNAASAKLAEAKINLDKMLDMHDDESMRLEIEEARNVFERCIFQLAPYLDLDSGFDSMVVALMAVITTMGPDLYTKEQVLVLSNVVYDLYHKMYLTDHEITEHLLQLYRCELHMNG